MPDYCIALCTCPDRDTAEQIARMVVSEKLAACVNILPGITSVYAWQGEICCDNEVQLIFKTRHREADNLFNRVLMLHPYDVPEWLLLDVADGGADYLKWIASSLS